MSKTENEKPAKLVPLKAASKASKACPTCKAALTSQDFKPFCSKRCADVDLGRWFNEGYSVPSIPSQEDD